MVQRHSRTPQEYPQWVSMLLASRGSSGVVSRLSQQIGVARQTLYRWKTKGQAALEAAFTPRLKGAGEGASQVERAILTLLMEGHASYRGIQHCLEGLLGIHISVGKIAEVVVLAGQRAQQWMSQHSPPTLRALALDELYGNQHGEGYPSAGRCPQWRGVGQHQPCGGRWRELDIGSLATRGARAALADHGQ